MIIKANPISSLENTLCEDARKADAIDILNLNYDYSRDKMTALLKAEIMNPEQPLNKRESRQPYYLAIAGHHFAAYHILRGKPN